MKVKKLFLAALLMVAAVSYGQNNNYIGQDYSVSPNVITTAVHNHKDTVHTNQMP